MRILLPLAALISVGGCAVIINPNDAEVRYAASSDSAGLKGNGQAGKDVRQVSGMRSLVIRNSKTADLTIEVRSGNQASLVVEGDSHLLPMVYSETQGGALKNEFSCRAARVVVVQRSAYRGSKS